MKKFFRAIGGFFGKVGEFCKKHKTLVALVVTAVFVLVQIPFLVSHEIWHDEAVPWEISKQITVENVYELNDAEPHPLLWELILAPFSQNNFPVITLNIISLVIVAVSVFLFIRFCPVNPFVKLVFLLSNGFFYYNPVIARNYCLIPLAIALVGIFYQKRHEKPIRYGIALALLSQTHFLMYGLLLALVLGFIIEEILSERKPGKTVLNILKVFIPVGLAILTVVPMVVGSFNNQAIITGKAFENVSEKSKPNFPVSLEGALYGIDNSVLNIAMIVVLGLFIVSLLAENLKVAVYGIAGLSFWLFVLVFIYPGYSMFEQKCAVLTLIVLGVTWILSLEPRDKKENIILKVLNFSEIVKFLRAHMKNPVTIFVAILVISTVPRTFYNAFMDLNNPFSSSKENAELVNSLPAGSIIIEGDIASYNQFGAAVRAQITNREVDFYSLTFKSSENYGRSLKYNNEYLESVANLETIKKEDALAKIAEAKENYEHVYFLRSSSRTSCSKYEVQVPLWLEDYEIVTELDYGTYKDAGHKPVMVYKLK